MKASSENDERGLWMAIDVMTYEYMTRKSNI